MPNSSHTDVQVYQLRPNAGAQSAFLRSEAPFPAMIAGQGGGKTWAGAARAVYQMLAYPHVDYLVVEPTYELIRQIAVPAICQHLDALGYESIFNAQTMELRIPGMGRGRVIFKSGAHAERITGFEVGGAWIDEPGRIPGFADDPRRDCYTNALARVRDPRVPPARRGIAVTGTHEGVGTWFWEHWEGRPLPGHVVYRGATTENITPGIAEYAARLEEIYGPELARQYVYGYAVQELTSAIQWDTLVGLQDDRCTAQPDWRRLADLPGPLAVGMDIGRTESLTAFWILRLDNDELITEAVVEMRRASFAAQDDMLDRIVRLPGFDQLAIDSTYNPQTAERAVERWGSTAVEAVQFTQATKLELAHSMIANAQSGRLRIPESETVVHDLYSVKRTVSPRGVVQFHAPYTRDGHADRFWACALALRAVRPHYDRWTASLGPPARAAGARSW